MQYNKVITGNYDWKLKKGKGNKINNVVMAKFCIVIFELRQYKLQYFRA